MAFIREYLISVTAAAMVCCVLVKLSGDKSAVSSVIKLLAGLFMAVTVVKPLTGHPFTDLKFFPEDISAEAAMITEEGKEMALQEMETIIIQKTQAYIIEKALDMGAELQVQISLQDGLPAEAVLTGAVSPIAKSQLSSWIETNIGIPGEAQEWIS